MDFSNNELSIEQLDLVNGGDHVGSGGGAAGRIGPPVTGNGDGMGWLRNAVKAVESFIGTFF